MKSVSGKYFLLNFGLTHTIYIMIDWGQAGLCRAGQGQGRENSSADSNPWSNPGPSTASPASTWDWFIPSVNQSRGERAWPCCTQPALLRSVPIREGRIGMRERCSRLCHTAHRPRYEPIFPLVSGDDDVFLILTPLTAGPMSHCWCHLSLHVDLISVSVWLPAEPCTPVHCTCQFSLSFTRSGPYLDRDRTCTSSVQQMIKPPSYMYTQRSWRKCCKIKGIIQERKLTQPQKLNILKFFRIGFSFH